MLTSPLRSPSCCVKDTWWGNLLTNDDNKAFTVAGATYDFRGLVELAMSPASVKVCAGSQGPGKACTAPGSASATYCSAKCVKAVGDHSNGCSFNLARYASILVYFSQVRPCHFRLAWLRLSPSDSVSL